MAKPSELPQWGTAQANEAEPVAQKTDGWDYQAPVISSYMNWFKRIVYDWLNWVNDVLDENGFGADAIRLKPQNSAGGAGTCYLELNDAGGESTVESSGEVFLNASSGGVHAVSSDGLFVSGTDGVQVSRITSPAGLNQELLGENFALAAPADVTTVSTEATIVTGQEHGHALVALRNSSTQEMFGVTSHAGNSGNETGQDRLAFSVSAGGAAAAYGALICNTADAVTGSLYFGPTVKGDRIALDQTDGGIFQFYMNSVLNYSMDDDAILPEQQGRDLGSSSQKFDNAYVNRIRAEGTPPAISSNDDILFRHNENSVVARATFDYNATVPAVPYLHPFDWNIDVGGTPLTRVATGIYDVELDQPVSLYSQAIVNCPSRNAVAEITGTTTVRIYLYALGTSTLTDPPTVGGTTNPANMVTLTVIGGPA